MKSFADKWKQKIAEGLGSAHSKLKEAGENVSRQIAGGDLVGTIRQNMASTINRAGEALDSFRERHGDKIDAVKKHYGKIRDQVVFLMATADAKTIEREHLSFEQANALTTQLLAGRNGQVANAVASMARIMAEVRENLSDPDYKAIEGRFEAIDRANLANLEVARRLTDKNFYVGLLGEFSCGKSTFINAMLEDQILHDDILQGTTCAKTVVQYGERERIRVIFGDDTYIELEAPNGEKLIDQERRREFVRLVTADEKRAQSIREVICELPNAVLDNGLAIVDTPGIGSLNPRHTEVARAAVGDCDAVLVLTTLDRPLSAELLGGVKQLVGEDAPNCIFIGTRKDQLPKKELPRQGRHFARKLKNEFGRECLFEFVSAYKALQELAGAENAAGGLEEFREFRKQVRNFLEENRQNIQLRRTKILINNLLADLGANLKRQKEDFAAKIAEYHKQVVPEDSARWQEWEKDINWRFSIALKEVGRSYKVGAIELVEQIASAIEYKINECKETSDLKKYLSGGINSTLESFSGELENCAVNLVHAPLQKEMADLLEAHGEKYRREYDKMERIFGVGLQNNLRVRGDRKLGVNVEVASGDFENLAAEMETEENIKMGGGMAAGIGLSLLVPGVGWLVGGTLALLGGALGAGLMKSLAKRKKEALEKVGEAMDDLEKRLLEGLDRTFQTAAPRYAHAFANAMEDQRREYANVIRENNDFMQRISRKLGESSQFITARMAGLEQCREKLNARTEPQIFQSIAATDAAREE